MTPSVEAVTSLLEGVGTPSKDQVEQAINIAHAVVDAYVRGVAVTPGGEYRPGVGEIVTALAARMVANPTGGQYASTAGPFTTSRGAGVRGLLLHERIVLDRYRKSATAR